MICRCATSRVAVVNRVKKQPNFCFFLHPFHSWCIFQHVLLLFVMPFTVPVGCIFLPSRELTYTGYQGMFEDDVPYCHSFPQICASSPGGSIFVCFVDRFPRATATPLYGLGFSPCAITHRSRQCIGCPGSPFPFFGDGKGHGGFTRGDNLGGGFVSISWFCLPRSLGKWSNLTHVCQMGWNHQLAMDENNANVDYNIRIQSDTVLYDTMSSKII